MPHDKQETSQGVPMLCPCCKHHFECDIYQLKAGSKIACPACKSRVECRTRELFAAIRHIHRMVS